MGIAYGFFDCNASKSEIESELPTIRELAQTPSGLELTLIEGVENLKCDSKLRPIVEEAKKAGLKYVLEARYKGSSKEIAHEVKDILIQAYQSLLFQEGEDFCGEVAFEENGKYVVLE